MIWFDYFEVVMAFEFSVLIEVISHFRLQNAELLATNRNRLPCDALGKGRAFLLFFFEVRLFAHSAGFREEWNGVDLLVVGVLLGLLEQ